MTDTAPTPPPAAAPTAQLPVGRAEKSPPNPVTQTRNRLIVAIVVGIVLIGVCYFFYTKPALSSKSTAAASVVTEQNALQTTNQQLSLAKGSTQSQADFTLSRTLDVLLPLALDPTNLGLVAIPGVITSAGCQYSNMVPPTTIPTGHAGQAQYGLFSVTAVCTPANLTALLASFPSQTPLMTLDSIAVTAPNPNGSSTPSSSSSSSSASSSSVVVPAGDASAVLGIKVWYYPHATLP